MQGRNVISVALLMVMFSLASWGAPAHAWARSSGVSLSKGQAVYVPVYSNVFTGPRRLPFQLATTLSIRNTDLSVSIRVTSIDYYDTKGKMVRRYLGRPLEVRPLASAFIHIEEKDVTGGFGANFIVRWNAGKVVNNPIIECVMIGATSGQGISFVSPGQEIRE
ncbi:MAG: DUF3124 domain-containing protein [Desulfuromonadaceae bacterium]|nr:DUF3124 domain-containing protein [Desulfuromonadaceae bacterium]